MKGTFSRSRRNSSIGRHNGNRIETGNARFSENVFFRLEKSVFFLSKNSSGSENDLLSICAASLFQVSRIGKTISKLHLLGSISGVLMIGMRWDLDGRINRLQNVEFTKNRTKTVKNERNERSSKVNLIYAVSHLELPARFGHDYRNRERKKSHLARKHTSQRILCKVILEIVAKGFLGKPCICILKLTFSDQGGGSAFPG